MHGEGPCLQTQFKSIRTQINVESTKLNNQLIQYLLTIICVSFELIKLRCVIDGDYRS